MKNTIRFPNGQKVKPTFAKAEYQQRLQTLRQLMSEHNMDVVLFTSIHNINYYSDFLYCAFGRPYGCLITQERLVTLSANIDGGQPWRRTVGDDNRIYTDWQSDNFFKLIADECQHFSGNMGVEFDHLTLERQQKLQHAVPKLTIVDISQPVMQLRMIKTDAEIEHITKAAAIADMGGQACVEAIAEHAPEYEVALHATSTMVREIAQQFPHSELMDTWTWFQSGINTDGAHNPVTSRTIA